MQEIILNKSHLKRMYIFYSSAFMYIHIVHFACKRVEQEKEKELEQEPLEPPQQDNRLPVIVFTLNFN